MQNHPQGLGPCLKRRDFGESLGDHRDHDDRADQVSQNHGNAKTELHRKGQNCGLKCKENKGETGINQGRHRRPDIAKPRPPRQQVNVDPVLGGVIADREARQEQDDPHQHDRRHRDIEPIGKGQGTADRLKRQKRDRPDRGICDAPIGPFARPTCRKTQREIFHGFIGHPTVIAPTLLRGFCPDQHEMPISPRAICARCAPRLATGRCPENHYGVEKRAVTYVIRRILQCSNLRT